jgi:hypothetical protein
MYFRELRASCPDFGVKKWLVCRLDDWKFEFDSLKWKKISFPSQSGHRPRNHGSIPGMGKRLISSHENSDRPCGVHRASGAIVTGCLCPGIKRLAREADHSPYRLPRLRMSGTIPPLPLCIHGLDWHNFACSLRSDPQAYPPSGSRRASPPPPLVK